MNTHPTPFSLPFFLLTAGLAWLVSALCGALFMSWFGTFSSREVAGSEWLWMGVRYFGGLGLYVGPQAAFLLTLRRAGQTGRARAWRARFLGFHFIVLEICALGGLLGALAFAVVGTLAGVHKTTAELIVLGLKRGAFFFLVWAPGLALVRMFIRAAKTRPGNALSPDSAA